MPHLSKILKVEAVLLGAILLCAGLFVYSLTPGYSRATDIDPAEEGSIKIAGKADLQAVHRLGIIVGTVHRNDCMLEGVSSRDDYDYSIPSGYTGDIAADVGAALRTQGLQVTETKAGPLATHQAGVKLGPFHSSDGLPCTKTHSQQEQNDALTNLGAILTYPPVPALATAMASLPFDAVLIVDVDSAGVSPWQGGAILAPATPAGAYMGLNAQLIAKDGSVPWAASVDASGHLRHPGLHLSLSGTSGPAPRLEPVRDVAVARLAALLK